MYMLALKCVVNLILVWSQICLGSVLGKKNDVGNHKLIVIPNCLNWVSECIFMTCLKVGFKELFQCNTLFQCTVIPCSWSLNQCLIEFWKSNMNLMPNNYYNKCFPTQQSNHQPLVNMHTLYKQNYPLKRGCKILHPKQVFNVIIFV